MMDSTTIPANNMSCKDFLFKDKRNTTISWLAGIAIVVQFAVFKYFYPFASYIHGDSFVYIRTAYLNLNINTYMVGYSRFLRLFSAFTNSDTALVFFQYILLHTSILFFLFTIFYLYKPVRLTQYFLLCFMIFNPLFLHLSNLVSSDCFFASLSLIWFGLLLWLIHAPKHFIIITQALLLFVLFTVRYNALIYPFVAAIAFYISPLSGLKKLGGISLGLILCSLFIFYTTYNYKKLTGFWQYSPFSGWQLVNNAMYTYRYVNKPDRKPVPKQFKKLDSMICAYFDSTRDVKRYPAEAIMASTAYMWTPTSPLYQYRNMLYTNDSTASEFKRWASIAPFYKKYGLFIIKQYPLQFAKYFLWPNAKKYYAPPIEFLEAYNSGKDSVNTVAQVWFGYNSKKVFTRTKNLKASSLAWCPILTGIVNVILLCSLFCFLLLFKGNSDALFTKCIFLVAVMWLTNAAFTISASSAALRYQVFPILLVTTFSMVLIDWLCQVAVKLETKKDNQMLQNLTYQ